MKIPKHIVDYIEGKNLDYIEKKVGLRKRIENVEVGVDEDKILQIINKGLLPCDQSKGTIYKLWSPEATANLLAKDEPITWEVKE